MYGKTHSIETKERIRAVRLGTKHTDIAKKKVSDSLSGNTRRLGIPQSDETKRKIGNTLRNRKLSPKVHL